MMFSCVLNDCAARKDLAGTRFAEVKSEILLKALKDDFCRLTAGLGDVRRCDLRNRGAAEA
jgi:hypothetical protein